MNILSIGNLNGESNTCLHRHWGLIKCGSVDALNTYKSPIDKLYRILNKLFSYGLPFSLPDNSNVNSQIKLCVKLKFYDIIWIDKGLIINASTLQYVKDISPNTRIVSYSPDNMALRHNQSQNYLNCIPFYDYIFTNKSYILNDMRKLGAKNIYFVNNSYESSFHFPRKLERDDYERLGGEVGFIGAWERERFESVLYLAQNGINVKIFGDGKWNEYKNIPNLEVLPGIFSEDYSKALQAFKISLCFLRKTNFDQQTTRTMEIPACGGFMIAERTEEHLSLFEEDKEAVYFSSNEELLNKCLYYLSHEEERHAIQKAGTLRCEISKYSNEDSVKRMINMVLNNG